jgi:membrane-associated PAP2 superfamily phosphatase
VLGAAAFLIWLAFHAGGLDRTISAAFGGRGGFPLREDWFLTRVGHDGLKWAMLAFWAACVCWKPLRRGALYMAVAAAAVTLLKNASPVSCPWDLPEYGGTAPAGRCLPAGHPVAGFALIGLYFALEPQRPRLARAALGAACAIGLAAGAVQVARGAHFASHVLWTAWVSWASVAATDWLARRQGRMAQWRA